MHGFHRWRPLLACLLLLAGVAPAQEATEAGWTRVPLRYQVARKFRLELPAERWDPIGETLALGQSPRSVRLVGTALEVDLDGDGAFDARVEGTDGFLLLRDPEDPAHRRALRLVVTTGWVCAPGGFWRGTIEGVPILVIDQDNDGRYDGVGVDAMAVGPRPRIAHFLSRTVCLGDRLLEIRVAPDGRYLEHRPWGGPSGTLALASSFETKGKLRSLLVRSEDGQHCFQAAEGALRVPATTYVLHAGEIALARNRVRFDRGRATPFAVPADGRAAPAFGGPLSAEFRYARNGNQLVISPSDVHYFGRGGERYSVWEPIGKSPRFLVRSKSGREIAQALFPGSC